MNVTLTERMREASLLVFNSSKADNQLRNRIRSSLGNYLNEPLPKYEPLSPSPSDDGAEVPLLQEDGSEELIENEKPKSHPYPVELLKLISQFLLKKENAETGLETSKYWLHELIKGSAIYIEPQAKKSKNQELTNRLNQINIDQQNREYYQMVANVDPSFSINQTPNTYVSTQTIQSEWNEVKASVTAILNILFSAIAVFAAGYYISYQLTDDIGLRILVGLLGAFVIAGAETFLYVRHMASNTSNIRSF